LTVRNQASVWEDVNILDEVPAELEILGTSDDAHVNRTGQTIVWKVDDLAAGEEKTLTINVRLKTLPTTGTTVTNIATATSPNYDNLTDQATVETDYQEVILENEKTVAHLDGSPITEWVKVGDTILYTITVKNIREHSEARAIRVVDELP